MSRERLLNWLFGALGIGIFLVGWEIVGRTGAAGSTFPPITAIISYVIDPSHRELLKGAIGATSYSAVVGLIVGTVVAVVIAGLGALFPLLKDGIDRFAASVHAVPLIALGPLFIVVVSRQDTPILIAALSAFFPVYVTLVSGFEVASQTYLDVFAALGAGPWTRIRRVQAPAALPAFSDGLQLAAPAAVLGAILGEWFGAPRGIGILIVSSMQNFQIQLLWASALLASILSLFAYGLFGMLQRFAVSRYR